MKHATLFLFAAFSLNFANAQHWAQTNGPTGGFVSLFSKNPLNGDLYCNFSWPRVFGNNGKGGNFYKSTTNCSSWTNAGNGLSTQSVLSLAFYPGSATNAAICIDDKYNKSGSAYTPTTYLPIAYTNNGGISWSIQNSSTFPSDDWAKVIVADNNWKLYAGRAKNGTTCLGGVDVSTNNGQTWQQQSNGLTNKRITDLCFGYNGKLYAGTDYHATFNPVNGDVFVLNGTTWASMGVPPVNVVNLLYDANTVKLYAVGNDPTSGNCVVYVSVSGGPFSLVIPNLNFVVRKAVLDPNGNIHILSTGSGAYEYDASTNVFTAMSSTGLPPITNFTLQNIQVDNAGTVYVTGLDGIYKTTSSSLPWTTYNNGIAKYNHYGQELMFNDLNQLFLTTGNGTYMSPDYGNTWSLYGLQYLPCWSLFNYGGGRLMAAMYGNGTHVYESLNNGASWTPNQTGLPVNIYAKTGLAKNSSNEMFLSIGASAQVFKSNVGCTAWTGGNCGCGMPANKIATAIRISATDVIFVGLDDGGIYRSTDGGANYSNSFTPNGGDISSIRFNSQGDVFFASAKRPSSGPSGVFRSADGGNTWSANLYPITGSINCMTISPMDSIYIGTDAGVFVSGDNGNTWSPRNTGFGANISVLFLCVGPDGYLYASVAGASVWRSTYNVLPQTGMEEQLFSGISIFPNPSNGITNLSFSSAVSGSSHVMVTDVSGKRVMMAPINFTAGKNKFQFDDSYLDAGIYFLEFEYAGNRVKEKLVIE
jgi:hypothetical protein